MNENRIISQRHHTRVKFRPLSVSCTLVCLTPQSPAAQAVNTTLSPVEYEPDRKMTPTVIMPDVRAVDPDKVFTSGPANYLLSLDSIQWTVDGKPIATVWTENTDYEIITDEGDTRGCLRIKKNFDAGQKASIRFSGEFLDWRTGIAYNVESDDMALSCTDKGEDELKCYADKPSIEYDPLYDNLLLYEYKQGKGLPVSGTRAEQFDGKQYEQTVNIVLSKGVTQLKKLPAGMTMRVVLPGTGLALVPNSEKSPEILSVAYPSVKFDLRLIDSASYDVVFLNNGVIVAREAIGIHRSTTMPAQAQPRMASDIAANQQMYVNYAMINLNDREVQHAELYYDITWKTQATYNDSGTWKYAAEKQWQSGERIEAPVSGLDIGNTRNDAFFDVWFELDARGACTLVTDEAGAVLTDEAGVMLMD